MFTDELMLFPEAWIHLQGNLSNTGTFVIEIFAPLSLGTAVFALSIGTPYLLTILVLNLKPSNLLPPDVSKILLYVGQTV